jgi:hypothetical protein
MPTVRCVPLMTCCTFINLFDVAFILFIGMMRWAVLFWSVLYIIGEHCIYLLGVLWFHFVHSVLIWSLYHSYMHSRYSVSSVVADILPHCSALFVLYLMHLPVLHSFLILFCCCCCCCWLYILLFLLYIVCCSDDITILLHCCCWCILPLNWHLFSILSVFVIRCPGMMVTAWWLMHYSAIHSSASAMGLFLPAFMMLLYIVDGDDIVHFQNAW